MFGLAPSVKDTPRKVEISRIALKFKLGQAYPAVVFAALCCSSQPSQNCGWGKTSCAAQRSVSRASDTL